MGLRGILHIPTGYPANLNRLYPSVSNTTVGPTIASTGNGLGYFAAPPESINRIPAMRGVGMLTPWPQIPREWDMIQQETWKNHTPFVKTHSGLGDTPVYVPPSSSSPDWATFVNPTVARIDEMYPDDYHYAPNVMAAAVANANYYGSAVAAAPEVVAALDRLQKRYTFYKANYPGTSLLAAGETMPSGGSARPPIVLAFSDGSFAYAPGYGPVSQYGANQVVSSSVPASPRVSAYTGQIVGTASTTDVIAATVGAHGEHGPGWVDPITNAPPPPDNYAGPITYSTPPAITGDTGAGSGTIGGIDTKYLLAGGVLIAVMALMKR